jgi:hypothetical protein
MKYLKKNPVKSADEQIYVLINDKAEKLSEITHFMKEFMLLKTAV